MLTITFGEWLTAPDEKIRVEIVTMAQHMTLSFVRLEEDDGKSPAAQRVDLDVRHIRRLIKVLNRARRFVEDEENTELSTGRCQHG